MKHTTQHDNFVPTMTAAETVGFYASVVLPPSTSAQARRSRVAAVLQLMGLTGQRHTLVSSVCIRYGAWPAHLHTCSTLAG